MLLLQVLFFSPLVAAALAVLLVVYANLAMLPKPNASSLIRRSLLFAFIGAGLSLAFTIIWMVWYEKTTGYSAGNAPLGWMFFYGPPSVALGQFAALVQWWFTKEAT